MLQDVLEEYWPPRRIIATCDTCGRELLDTKKNRPTIWSASYVSRLIGLHARKHKEQEGHSSIDVGVEPHPEPVREIECTITVNQND